MKKRWMIALLCLMLVCTLTACNLDSFISGGLVGELLENVGEETQNVLDEILSDIPDDTVGELDYGWVETMIDELWTEDIGIEEPWVEETWVEETWVEEETYVEIETIEPFVELPRELYSGMPLVLLGVNESDLGILYSEKDDVAAMTYARNLAMQENFGITVEAKLLNAGELHSALRMDATAGAGDFDIAFGSIAHDGALAAQDGIILNLSELPWIDLTNSRWDEDMYNGLAVGEYLPMATGQVTPDTAMKTSLLVFNTVQAEESGMDLYSYVTDGGWTLEKMYAIVEDTYQDLNGNGQVDQEDRFGFVGTYSSAEAFAVATNSQIVVKNADGIPEMVSDTAPIMQVFDTLYAMINSKGSYYVSWFDRLDYEQKNMPGKIYEDKNALFYAATPEEAIRLSQNAVFFGILPYPKAQMDDTAYCSAVSCDSTAVMVPISVKDVDFAGYSLEALTQMTDAGYENRMMARISQTAQDMEMLQIVLNNQVFDFGCNYLSAEYSSCVMVFREVLEYDSNTIASTMKRGERALEKQVLKLIEKMTN